MYSLKQVLITALIVAILFSGIGFFGSELLNRDDYSFTTEYVDGVDLQSGLKAAYDRLIRRGHAAVVRGYGLRESDSIAGEIKSIQTDQLDLAVNPINPLADPSLDTRIIKITNKTKFYREVAKDYEQLENEMDEFQSVMGGAIGEGTEDFSLPELPLPFFNTEIDRLELAVGKEIEVKAEMDIHNIKEFEALEIILK
jgi:hypothetical protein